MGTSRSALQASMGLLLIVLAGCSRTSGASKLDMPVSTETRALEGTSAWGSSNVKLPLPFTAWDRGPVKIVQITHGCACLSVDPIFDGKELSPGSAQTVNVSISVPVGYAQKKAVVEFITDPPMPEPLVVSICGTAIGVPSFWPQFLHVETPWGQKPQGIVDLFYYCFANDPELTLNKDACQLGPFVIAEQNLRSEQPPDLSGYSKAPRKEHINLKLEIKEPLAIGTYRHELRFAWDQGVPECVIPTIVRVHHPLRPVAEVLDCGKLLPGKTWTMDVPLVPKDEVKVHVKTVKCEGGAVAAHLTEDGHSLTVKVTAPAKAGRFENSVILSFDDPALPELRLPVSGTVDDEKP